jgi:hypothetical protein
VSDVDPNAMSGAHVVELRFTVAPRDARWQLRGGGPGTRVGLLGWVVDQPPVDAGVPPELGRLLARAIVRSHLAIFLSDVGQAAPSRHWTRTGAAWQCSLRPDTPSLSFKRSGFPCVATTDAALTATAFEVDAFPWDQRGQMILLSTRRDSPPVLTHRDVWKLFNDTPIDVTAPPILEGIGGVLLPGVDGDFAEFVAFEDRTWRELQDDLQKECSAAGIAWLVLSEDVFNKTVWVRGHSADG